MDIKTNCSEQFLFTIHGFKNKNYVPLVFALLHDKNSHTYITVVVDFKMAIHNAIKNIWPTVQIHGCNFHLCQNWYRKIKQLGLTNDYNNGKSEIGKFLVLTFGLPLLQDANDIEYYFVFDLFENMPSNNKVQQYCDYLSENYTFSFSLFPPKMWSSNDTTNACESFHLRFYRSFYHYHPNLHLFVKVLKDIQTETYIKIRSSHTTQCRQTKTISNYQFILNQKYKYIRGEISRLEFISKFTQLFTIHGMKNNSYIPTFSILLTFGQSFNHAIHVAVNKVWPSTRLRRCRFHLGQAWFRKIQSLGLVDEYKNKNYEIGKYLKTFFGLSFLNPPDVNDCFTDDLISILPQDYRMECFTDYILENHITESSQYPPELWASFTYSLARTTNSCESFHSKINAMLYSAHPNIYQFINILLNIQCETYIKIRSIHIINTRNSIPKR
ncbi:hypothetical protein AGLY_015397 [Aphis glycines]|uniref:MULE transposase domain-containing protein n=1 Tax=Aphis glycines TaxID=307491 RepID=A0A6G0T1S7_APHGL|nr:hypothetical protein AGLY_015397 [Aphis glycines]